MKFLIGLVLLNFMISFISCTDYCNTRCEKGAKNIGCCATDKFGPNCPKNASRYYFNKEQKSLILHLHNDLRNAICNGSISAYKPCSKSARMVWDDELAYLAGLNTRSCKVAHDKCRSTDKFHAAGQNIGSSGVWRGYPTPEEVIIKNVNGWFSEYKNADMSYIDSYHSCKSGKAIGHFTQLVHSNAIAVGCGATQYFKDECGYYIITCNYALTNVVGYPIYVRASKGGSGCTKGTDKKYMALCSLREPISPNKLEGSSYPAVF